MLNKIFKSTGHAVVRKPLFSIESVYELSEEKLKKLIHQPDFLEAVWLASPTLYSQALKWEKGELNDRQTKKVIYSLAKYYQRLCTRTTPFGLFAGTSVVHFDSLPSTRLNQVKRRSTRIDMEFICSLIDLIEQNSSLRPQLLYKANSSIYTVLNKIRYVEYAFKGNKRIYSISEVEANNVIDRIINDSKVNDSNYEHLLSIIDVPDVSVEEKVVFINELIDNQILVSNLQPVITNTNPVNGLITELNKCNTEGSFTNLITVLKSINDQLDRLDLEEFNEDRIVIYRKVAHSLKSLGIEYDIGKLFQVDISFLNPDVSLLSNDEVDGMLKKIDSSFLMQTKSTSSLSVFATKYRERYGEADMPLTQVLDPDVGIGFPIMNDSSDTPLVNDLTVKNNSRNIAPSDIDNFLLKILINANVNKKYSIDFNDEIGKYFKSSDNIDSDFQPSLRATLKKVVLNEKEYLCLKSISGHSALDTFSRFTHVDTELEDVVQTISKHEKNVLKNSVVAEIIHLPESRIGNIISRNNIYDYQIGYCGNTSVSKEFVIDINDIVVSVNSHNKVIIKSKALQKEIVPRLCNAHNFTLSPLPIYEFLCALQNQSNVKNVLFDWGLHKPHFKFLPRVVQDNIILSPLMFNVEHDDIRDIVRKINDGVDFAAIKLDIEKWRELSEIPERAYLAVYDNELFIDFKNELSVRTFFNEVKSIPRFVLTEFLDFPRNDNEKSYANEYMIPLLNRYNNRREFRKPVQAEEVDIKPKLVLGTEVVYFKLYGGHKYLEDWLVNDLKPIVQKLFEADFISKWFFIRYHDSDYHIRVRLFVKNAKHITEVIKQIKGITESYLEKDVFSKLVFDTYEREMSRYKGKHIIASEDFFCSDSNYVCDMISLFKDSVDPERYRWTATLININSILNLAGLDTQKKSEIFSFLRKAFFEEHGGDKGLHKLLNAKYRKEKDLVESVLDAEVYTDAYFQEHINLINTRAAALKNVFAKLNTELNEDDLTEIVCSFIHMTCNRTFVSSQRKYELVLYDFLERYYKSLLHRNKIS